MKEKKKETPTVLEKIPGHLEALFFFGFWFVMPPHS